MIDLYTKTGNLHGYGGNWILIPDFDVGVVVMMGDERNIGQVIVGAIVDGLLSALDEAARL